MRSTIRFSIDSELSALGEADRQRLLERTFAPEPAIVDAVSEIIEEVAGEGDAALHAMAKRFDGVSLDALEVPRESWRVARREVPMELVGALEMARDRIVAFHHRQLPSADEFDSGDGIRLGRRPEALETVGAYAPGGRAAYPSSVLMCVVPAKLAGVNQVVVCSPPCEGGTPAATVLAACDVAGADRLFAIGGAGAVAALAYATESVPRADKVVGPGNVYVTEAKRQLAGRIASDCLAGPSELLIVADATARVDVVARELIAQAEHDPDAVVVAVVPDRPTADQVRTEVERLAAAQPRHEVIGQALARGGALLVGDTDEALAFVGAFAPEHLMLLVEDPRTAMSRVRRAGSIFLGPSSSVVFGDYMSGTNHVLPTAGQCRSQSGLSVADFVRWSTYQEIDHEGAARLADSTAVIASAEGLEGHAAASRAWSSSQGAARGRVGGDPSWQGVEGDSSSHAAVGSRPAVRPRPGYGDLTTYDPGRSPVEVDLSDNTSLFGQAPSATRVLASLEADEVRRYPSLYGGELKEAAADYFGVPATCIATGCGSDDLIDSTIRAFCSPGDGVAFPVPTFSMIETFARMNGARALGVDMAPGFELDAEKLIEAQAAISYVCRPNNPTGNACPRADVETLAKGAKGLVLIDEAYGDFFGDPLVAWAPETNRVVVLRTMSKAFGLAGLRVGFAVGPPELIGEIEKSRGPYKVGVVAEAAAAAALRQDREWLGTTVTQAVDARERLVADLDRLGLRVYPSAANFLLVEAPAGDSLAFSRGLNASGVGVRPFPGLPGAGDCVRVTVGPQHLMDRFLARTEELLQQ